MFKWLISASSSLYYALLLHYIIVIIVGVFTHFIWFYDLLLEHYRENLWYKKDGTHSRRWKTLEFCSVSENNSDSQSFMILRIIQIHRIPWFEQLTWNLRLFLSSLNLRYYTYKISCKMHIILSKDSDLVKQGFFLLPLVWLQLFLIGWVK